jgi:hypothetical protein
LDAARHARLAYGTLTMFQFENWPYALSEDLRIIRRRKEDDDPLCTVYSLALDACTQVKLEEVERLKAEGVPEISGTPST